MNRGLASMALGIAAAAAVGTAAYMLNERGHNRKLRRFKRGAERTLHTVEGVIDGMSSMLG